MIRQVFYVSEVSPGLGEQAIQMILGVSRVNNWRHDITALLMCSGRHFAQVVEGRHDAVERLMARLRADQRHFGMRILSDTRTALRGFGDWSMAYLPSDELSSELDRLATSRQGFDGDLEAMLSKLRLSQATGVL